MNFDIVFIADARFSGGSSTALETEIRTAARLGYKIGLMLVKGPLLPGFVPLHDKIRALLDGGVIERIDPKLAITTKLAIIHHPTIMANRPTSQLNFETDKLVLVLHHPTHNNVGKKQYDITKVVKHCHEAFSKPVHIAPVSDVVRTSLPNQIPGKCQILPDNWQNLIIMDDWPALERNNPVFPVVIGRHSRPDPLKWPNKLSSALKAYPADQDKYRIKILGADDFLDKLYKHKIPANWECMVYSSNNVSSFLRSLDFYVYFHSKEWREAFGRTILEAIATGLVVILPPHFEELFLDSAIYCEVDDVPDRIKWFVENPEEYEKQSARARGYAQMVHSSELFAFRLTALGLKSAIGENDVAASAQGLVSPLPVRNIIFVSSNGIGVGHLVQQMAIARRLPLNLRSTFATMCYSMKSVIDEGYLAHFLTYHRHIGADHADWNAVLSEEIFDLLAASRPSVICYDATSVFDGVADAMSKFPDMFKIWVRRAMWREIHRPLLKMSKEFDAIIEPGELAFEFDKGPTASKRSNVYVVPPVLHLEPSDRLSPKLAREMLDLPDEATVIAVQLGAGTNFDMAPVRTAIIDALLTHQGVVVLDICSPLASNIQGYWSDNPNYRNIHLSPMFRYSRGFDAAVCAAGYNTFHEQVLGAIPTLFVPNEADEMDSQLSRARWAQLNGCGLLLRRDYDFYHVAEYARQLLDKNERQRISQSCRNIEWENGARHIARFVEDHARIVRTDWDITQNID